MGFIAAAIPAAIGLAGTLATSSKSTPTTVNPNTYNMYGQANTPNTGGITSMQNIFGDLNSSGFQNQVSNAQNSYVNSLQSAASNPGISSIYNYAQNELNGNNLQNSLTNNYANQAYQSQLSAAGNQNAQTNASFARAGMGFSTANQQAQQANTAAAASQGATLRSGILSQNEQFERQMQQQAPGIMSSAIGMPSQYLSQVNNALYSPYQTQAGITSTLVGNNQTANPTLVQNPSSRASLASGVQTANGLSSAVSNSGLSSLLAGLV